MPDFNYTWVTEPPIDVSKGEEVKILSRPYAERLLANIKDYEGGFIAPEGLSSLSSDNLTNAKTMCAPFLKENIKENRILCTYLLTGQPVCLMFLTLKADYVFVNDVVVHPAAEFGGSIMIEFAVNYGVENGKRPCLELSPLNATSAGFYRGMGFDQHPNNANLMKLDLNQAPDKWQELAGKWRYNSSRNPGPMYAKTSRRPPPPPNTPKPMR